MGLVQSNPPPPPGGIGQSTPLANDDQVTWWCRLLAKAAGTIGGLVAMFLGIFACVTLYAKCIVAGILLMLFGFLVVAFEAPCVCPWLDFIDKISKFSESRPHWQKGVLYCSLGIIPILVCPEPTTAMGGAMLFVTGLLYGMFAMGKKADRETMMARAAPARSDGMETELVDGNRDPVMLS